MKTKRLVLRALMLAVMVSLIMPAEVLAGVSAHTADRTHHQQRPNKTRSTPKRTGGKQSSPNGPPILNYKELVELSTCGDTIRPELKAKMDQLLTTPFIGNIGTAKPHLPSIPHLGKSLRMVSWNIERGLNFDMIVPALSDPSAFARLIDTAKNPPGSKTYQRALEQVRILKEADVLILQEVDYGMRRTDYRFVAKELATALGMNYAYGVEFIEIDPVALGTEEFEGLPPEEREKLKREIAVDPELCHGLHGTAVLSRFPVERAVVQPLTPAYDWYHEELKPVSLPEKAKRGAVDKIFLEKILREVRRGGRTMLRVDLSVPDLPEKILTVIACHVEDKCKPEERRKQLDEILGRIQDVSNPVVVAGDMNTTLHDGTTTSIKHEITKRVGSKEFWATQGIKYATGVGLIWDVLTGSLNFFKNQHDPTAANIPVVAPNPELHFFEDLENFRFTDGNTFDFRGDKSRTSDGREGTLANSNQRDDKGFATTFEVERTVGPAGKFKIDWFFIKPYLHKPRDTKDSYRFAPHFGRTLYEVNTVVKDRISDHCPITVDLPLSEPR